MRKLLTILLLLAICTCGVAQTMPSWLQLKDTPLFDVRSYGARAGINHADATATAIQAAIDAAVANNGGRVLIPSDGKYYISKSLVVPYGYNNIIISGESTGSYINTTIATSAVILQNAVPFVDYSSRCIDTRIANLYLNGLTPSATSKGIDLVSGSRVVISNVTAINFGNGFYCAGSEVLLERCVSGACNVGIYCEHYIDGLVTIRDCWISNNTEAAIYCDSLRTLNLTNSVVSAPSGSVGLHWAGDDGQPVSASLNIRGTFFESGPNASDDNPQIKLARATRVINIWDCDFGEPGAEIAPYGSQHKMDIASGVRVLNMGGCTMGTSGSLEKDIVIRSTQEPFVFNLSELDTTMIGQFLNYTDERTSIQFNMFGSSFGQQVCCNPDFSKDQTGWALGADLTLASSTLFLATDGVGLAHPGGARTGTAADYAEWFPETSHLGLVKLYPIVVEAIVASVDSYTARCSFRVYVSDNDGTNVVALPGVSTVAAYGDGTSRHGVYLSFVVPSGQKLYSIAFGNIGGSASARTLEYFAVYAKGIPVDKANYWLKTTSPTTGIWYSGDRVQKRHPSDTPIAVTAGNTGFFYNGTTWTAY